MIPHLLFLLSKPPEKAQFLGTNALKRISIYQMLLRLS